MAGKSVAFSNALLKLVFNGTPIAGIADNAATSPITQLWVALHTADPDSTPASGQSASEANYTGYARVAINRNSAALSVSGDVLTTLVDVAFGKCTAGSNQVTHASIGTSQTGDGFVLYSGPLPYSVSVSAGVRPVMEAGTVLSDT